MIVLSLFFLIILVIFPKEVSDAVSQSLFMCFKDVIPALFPFSVVSGVLLNLSGSFTLPVFSFIERLFNISKKSVLAFFMGLLCGYPIGGKIALELYENGDISEAEKDRLLIFANNSGPGFIIGVAGATLLKDVKAGIVIYASHIVSAFIFGLATRKKSQKTIIIPVYKREKENFLKILAKSIKNSFEAVLGITGVICFFSGFTASIRLFPIVQTLPFNEFFLGLFEMTEGINKISRMDLSLIVKATLSSFLIGFSGVSIFMQLKVISDKIKTTAYFLNKLLFGMLCAFTTFIFFLSALCF